MFGACLLRTAGDDDALMNVSYIVQRQCDFMGIFYVSRIIGYFALPPPHVILCAVERGSDAAPSRVHDVVHEYSRRQADFVLL